LYAEGKGKRSYTHISLVVDGTLRSLDRIKDGHTIYNLGSEDTYETKKMLSFLADKLGVTPNIELLPHQLGDVMLTKASGAKAKRELGVSARVSLERGIAEFADWFLTNKKFLLGLTDMHS
jgi:nucleoside-diphosphate-sugar epimerase